MRRSASRFWLFVALLFSCLGIGESLAQANRAVALSGAGDFVELTSGALSNLNAATIELWVNFQSFDGELKRAFNYGSAWRDVSLGSRNAGEPYLVVAEKRGNLHEISASALLATNKWVHLAGTLGPQGMKLYMNGWIMGSTDYPGGFSATLPEALFFLGETVSTNDKPVAFHGYIDEVRVWRRVRSQNEIRGDMHRTFAGNEPDLAALWDFNDGTARDRGTNHWEGRLRGRASIQPIEIPTSIGQEEIFLDVRVRNSRSQLVGGTILEVMAGTNLLTTSHSKDGVFKLVLPAPNGPVEVRAFHLLGHTNVSRLNIPAGEQQFVAFNLPPDQASAENTNAYATAINHLLATDPINLEKFDAALISDIAPLLAPSEAKILSLFESPDKEQRRFIAMFVENFKHSSLPVVTALAKARRDSDEIVRGFAQRALEQLPVPSEFQALYTKRDRAMAMLFAGLLVPLALIHLLLFAVYPVKRSNLFLGLFALAGAFMMYFSSTRQSDSAAAQIAALAFTGLGLLVLYSLFYPRLAWNFWIVLSLICVAIVGVYIKRAEIADFSSLEAQVKSAGFKASLGVLAAIAGGYLALAVAWLDMLRVVLLSIWRRREGALLVGAGYFMLMAAMLVRFILYLALFGGRISPDTFANYIIYFPNVGAAGFVVCGSIYLSKLSAQLFFEVQAAKIEIEKKNAELTLARDLALSANKAKSQFLANMSHELRTPLNAIIGYSELIAEVADEEGHKGYLADLDKITTAARHQLMLVNDILDLSKIEAGKMTIVLKDFDVKAMIQEIKSVIAPLVSKRRNRLEIDCPPAVHRMHADETKVRQVLFNLLSNAAKFTEDGVITLRVRVDSGGGEPAISFEVIDTGIGMTPDQTSRLFQAFTQAEAGIHQKYGGTGLGLVISRRFCEMMGGTLTVQSDFGKGSAFTAKLPLRVKEPQSAVDASG